MEKLKMFYTDNGITPRLKNYFPKDDLYFRCTLLFTSGDTCVDRFNLLHEHSKYRWDNFDTVRPKHTDKSYIDICIEHARSIIKDHEKIAVIWSGGVDSTGVVAILVEAGMNPKNIDVIGTVSSLMEAPNFDNHFRKLGINYKEIPKDEYMFTSISKYTDATAVLTGICNDQLWHIGRSTMRKDEPDNLAIIKNNWKDQLLKDYKMFSLQKYVMNDIEIFDSFLKELDMECDSYAEFSQMVNFCTHYEFVKCFYTLQTNDPINSKLINFYDTQEFQDWGYTNRKNNAELVFLCNEGKTENYKKYLKELIYKHFPDEDYYKYKIKKPSVKTYKRSVVLPYYTVSIKTNKQTKFYHINSKASDKQYVNYALSLLEEFKK